MNPRAIINEISRSFVGDRFPQYAPNLERYIGALESGLPESAPARQSEFFLPPEFVSGAITAIVYGVVASLVHDLLKIRFSNAILLDNKYPLLLMTLHSPTAN